MEKEPAGWLKLNNPLTHFGNSAVPVYECDICWALVMRPDAHYEDVHRGGE